MLHQELAIRIGALIRFYLEEDYVQMRAQLWSEAPEAVASDALVAPEPAAEE